MFYFWARIMLWTAYPNSEVEGEEHTRTPGPMLVACNHPNTLIDPLMAGIQLHQRLYFLVHAGLMKSPGMAKFLHYIGCVPILRPQDVKKNLNVDNKDSFAQVYAHLARGRLLFVAPEGGSDLDRRLRRPLKTGIARMALQSAAHHNWQLDLKILPVATNYESPTACFNRAYVRIAPPVYVNEWRERYQDDPIKAVRELTEHVGDLMEERLIQTNDKAEERLLRPIERAIEHDRPQRIDLHLARVNRILADLRDLPAARRESLQATAAAYEAGLKKHGLSDYALSSHPNARLRPGTILGLPIFLWGWINHVLPIALANVVERKIGAERGYRMTIITLVSVILVTLFYVIQPVIVGLLTGSAVIAWTYLFSLPLAGWFAVGYWTTYRAFWYRLLQGGRVTEDLRRMRGELVDWWK
ncbi:MAG: 1-acyl-sn-glycerol-3-phosphate acyltransferase [Saprospiraceae bacterium]